jgi:hypothetical protein
MKNQPICETNKDGTKEWHLNGKLHREDSVAVEHVNGTNRWLINNHEVTKDYFISVYKFYGKDGSIY